MNWRCAPSVSLQQADDVAAIQGQKGGAAVGVEQELLQGLEPQVQGGEVVFVEPEQRRPALAVIFQGPGGGEEGEAGEEPLALHGVIEEALEKAPGPDDGLFPAAAGHLAAFEIGAAVEHGADVRVVLGIQLDGGAGGPFQALEVARHHLLLQRVGGERDQLAGAFRVQGQVVQHQAPEEHAEEADVEG